MKNHKVKIRYSVVYEADIIIAADSAIKAIDAGTIIIKGGNVEFTQTSQSVPTVVSVLELENT